MNSKTDNEIMRVLKVNEISHILAKTNLGELTVKLKKEEDTYNFFLDAVPFEEKENVELRKYFNLNG